VPVSEGFRSVKLILHFDLMPSLRHGFRHRDVLSLSSNACYRYTCTSLVFAYDTNVHACVLAHTNICVRVYMPSQFAQMVTLLTCIGDVFGSNLGRDTDSPEVLRAFQPPIQRSSSKMNVPMLDYDCFLSLPFFIRYSLSSDHFKLHSFTDCLFKRTTG
jgi:hypothetical protein